ncbi:MAG: chitobiase/beta-hexosaminidase C-terminal domain-containing protein, partial [Lentimicrobiaceae bacterium]|nr:chitobiase/beta-hexosaminidase C-terminal domain-containing protein [Lentimicrobiaceae bacterium]
MKKLFYLGLTALMMFFSLGSARGEGGLATVNLKVVLNPAEWTLGSSDNVPKFTVTITDASEEIATPAATVTLGAGEADTALMVIFKKSEQAVDTQLLTNNSVDLATGDLKLEAATYSLDYKLVVKSGEQYIDYEGEATDDEGCTKQLTVKAASTETPSTPDPDTVTVVLNSTTWQIGTAAPTLTASIKNVSGGNTLQIGQEATNVAVLAILTKDEVKDTVFINSTTATDVPTTKFTTAGEWDLTYELVKGSTTKENLVAFNTEDAAKVVVSNESAKTLTVTAAQTETPSTPDPDTVTVALNTPTWQIGTEAALTLTASIKNVESGNTLQIGDQEANVAVLAILTKSDVKDTVLINSTVATNVPTDKLTAAGEWKLTYELVKGNSTKANPEAFNTEEATKVVVSNESATTLTVTAAQTEPEPPTTVKPDTVNITSSALAQTGNKWVMGTASGPYLTVAVKKGMDNSTLKLGKADTNVAVLVIWRKDNVVDSQIFTGSAQLKKDSLTVGKWTLTYELVKGSSTLANPIAFDATKAVVGTTVDSVIVEKGTLPKPTFSPRTGEVDPGTEVTITCANKASKIYYTIDGTTPTASSREYNAEEGIVINEAVKIKAIAISTDAVNWNDSPIDSASYVVAVLPEDDEDAPEITFTPGNADSVDNNTEIRISSIDIDLNEYIVEYATYSSIAEANKGRNTEYYAYKNQYPVITVDDSILLIVVSKLAYVGRESFPVEEYKYYRSYKVRAAREVEMPVIMPFDPNNIWPSELAIYPEGYKVKIVADEGYTIWYTTDGSKPTVNGATSTKAGDMVTVPVESSMTIKAIAVNAQGAVSDVAFANYKLAKDVDAAVSLMQDQMLVDNVVGKNYPVSISFRSEYANELHILPYVVYYTTDGTEPSAEAYKAQAGEGPIKMFESDPLKDIVAHVILPQPATIKAKAYMNMATALAGMEGMEGVETGYDSVKDIIVSPLFVQKIDSVVSGIKNPEFSMAAGKIKVGDTLRIKNPNPYEADDDGFFDPWAPRKSVPQIFFSLNGEIPSIDKDGSQGVFHTDNMDYEEEVLIIIQEDEKGVYAYVPVASAYKYEKSDIDTIRFGEYLDIQAICYDVMDFGEPAEDWMPQPTIGYGSDFVKMIYTTLDIVATPAFSVPAGEVEKGTKVAITCATEGATIYYTVNGEEP